MALRVGPPPDVGTGRPERDEALAKRLNKNMKPDGSLDIVSVMYDVRALAWHMTMNAGEAPRFTLSTESGHLVSAAYHHGGRWVPERGWDEERKYLLARAEDLRSEADALEQRAAAIDRRLLLGEDEP
jgi:hypothetical protein